MGFRFRKSINLGGGFRINLSKSGIGYSFGVPGMRWTQMANGRTRSTYSIPGTGLAYISESSSDGNGNRSDYQPQPQPQRQEYLPEDGSLSYSASTDIQQDEENAGYDDFLEQVKTARSNRRNFTVAMWLTVILSLFIPFLFVIPIILLVIRFKNPNDYTVDLNYNFDDSYNDYYANLDDFLARLTSNNRIWGIQTSYKHNNTKYTSGANTTSERTLVQLTRGNAPYIKSNITPYMMVFMNKRFYFLPDRILIDGAEDVYSLRYSEINCEFATARFVEDETVPTDAEVIDHTWRYVNKDGSPDRRFRDNYQIPVCLYGTMKLTSNNGLDIFLHYSNHRTCQELKQLYDALVVRRLNFTFDL